MKHPSDHLVVLSHSSKEDYNSLLLLMAELYLRLLKPPEGQGLFLLKFGSIFLFPSPNTFCVGSCRHDTLILVQLNFLRVFFYKCWRSSFGYLRERQCTSLSCCLSWEILSYSNPATAKSWPIDLIWCSTDFLPTMGRTSHLQCCS